MRRSLQRVHIFAGLNQPALELLLERAQAASFPAGEVIVREGELSNRFYVIGSGSVRIVKRFGDPSAVELAVLEQGDFFGEMCILEPLPRAATVQAVAASELVSLSSLDFYHVYQAMPAQYALLLLNIARDLSRRLRRIDEVFAARH
ncbi:MAG: cyclic nucleotide-binding domain-containing protein [Verrucomicrobia bacterium]|nr:cyclic nucleotide-binding domain-containing protein [Verrucomicrobiota bacterium]